MNKKGRDKDGKYQKGREVPEEDRQKLAEAMKGNENKLKLKSADQRKVAYNAYCEWVASGRGKRGFVFECEDEETGKTIIITFQNMENYLTSKRADLDPTQLEKAENLSYQIWENVGIQMMKGEVEKCQPAIYQMMMRNKYGWDKETKVSHTYENDARKFLKYCEESGESPKTRDDGYTNCH